MQEKEGKWPRRPHPSPLLNAKFFMSFLAPYPPAPPAAVVYDHTSCRPDSSILKFLPCVQWLFKVDNPEKGQL